MINSLPGPAALLTWDAIWTLKNRDFRAFRRQQRRLYSRLGKPDCILGGPFKGMPYLRRATGSAFLPKLIGTYELELLPAIDDILRNPPDLIIDVGAAEGYYAVGLATRLPRVRIIAYDIFPPARYLLRCLARRNGVLDRVDIRGECTPTTLESDLATAQRPLVICDCEGYEDDLLQPARAPLLSRADLLVELHEMFRPGVTPRIKERFAATHVFQEFKTSERREAQAPASLGLSREEARLMMDEDRAADMQWLYMRPIEQTATQSLPEPHRPVTWA
jgi:hypothetical protein